MPNTREKLIEYYVVRDKNTGLYFRGKGVNRWGKYYNQATIYRVKGTAEHTIKEIAWRGEQAEVVPIQIVESQDANGVTVQEWIPVTERLPAYGEIVLAFGKRHATSGMFRGTTSKPNWWHWKGNMYKEVSHWMPLPEPPKGE